MDELNGGKNRLNSISDNEKTGAAIALSDMAAYHCVITAIKLKSISPALIDNTLLAELDLLADLSMRLAERFTGE